MPFIDNLKRPACGSKRDMLEFTTLQCVIKNCRWSQTCPSCRQQARTDSLHRVGRQPIFRSLYPSPAAVNKKLVNIYSIMEVLTRNQRNHLWLHLVKTSMTRYNESALTYFWIVLIWTLCLSVQVLFVNKLVVFTILFFFKSS